MTEGTPPMPDLQPPGDSTTDAQVGCCKPSGQHGGGGRGGGPDARPAASLQRVTPTLRVRPAANVVAVGPERLKKNYLQAKGRGRGRQGLPPRPLAGRGPPASTQNRQARARVHPATRASWLPRERPLPLPSPQADGGSTATTRKRLEDMLDETDGSAPVKARKRHSMDNAAANVMARLQLLSSLGSPDCVQPAKSAKISHPDRETAPPSSDDPFGP